MYIKRKNYVSLAILINVYQLIVLGASNNVIKCLKYEKEKDKMKNLDATRETNL